MKFNLPICVLFFTAATCLTWYRAGISITLFVIFTFLLALVFLFFKKFISWKVVVFSLVASLIGFSNVQLRSNYAQNTNLVSVNNIHCLVTELPKIGSHNSYRIIIQNKTYGTLQAVLQSGSSLPFLGDDIEISGLLVPVSKLKNKREEIYLRSQNISYKIQHAHINTLKGSSTLQSKFLRNIGLLQLKLTNVHKILLSEEQSSLMQAMLIGRSTSIPLDKHLWQLGQNLGVAHIYAASALNLTALTIFLAYIFSLFKIRKTDSIIYLIIATTLYSFVAGWVPSITRAWFIANTVLIGKLINREANLLNILLFALLLSLLIDPNLIADIGFQFSYLATLGIVLWNSKLVNRLNFIPASWAEPLAVTITAQALILPLQLYYFKNIPIYSIVANILAVPLANIILVLGLLASLFSMLGSIGWLLASGIDLIASIAINGLIAWLNFLGGLPGADLKLQSISIPWIIWLYAATLYLGFFAKERIIKHFIYASFTCLLIWTFFFQASYLTLQNISMQWVEGALVTTPAKNKILICKQKNPQPEKILKALQKLGITKLDWVLGNCQLPQEIEVHRVITLSKPGTILCEKNLLIKFNSQSVLISFHNFSALILLESNAASENSQFYSLVKFAFPQAKSVLWSLMPKAEICLTPKLSKIDRQEASNSLNRSCNQTFDYIDSQNQKIRTDGFSWEFVK